jgi:hypothetical protein
LKKILSLFLTMYVGNVFANTVVTLQGGMLQLGQPDAVRHQVTPRGVIYGGGMGLRRDYLEFEAVLLKNTASDSIKHDGADNEMIHDQTSLIFAMNFYIKRWLYARMGYGLHRIKQSFSESMSESSEAGAMREYGIRKNHVSEGMVFGGGALIYDGRNFKTSFQLENFGYSSMNASSWNGSLLLRFYVD